MAFFKAKTVRLPPFKQFVSMKVLKQNSKKFVFLFLVDGQKRKLS